METSTSEKKIHFFDKWGIYLSGTCVIHCILAPIFLIFYPTFSLVFLSNEALFHFFISVFILPSFLFVLYSYFKIHKQKKPLVYLFLGFSFILFSAFLAHDVLGHISEYLFSILGSLLMIRGHFINHNHCKACRTKQHCLGEKIFK